MTTEFDRTLETSLASQALMDHLHNALKDSQQSNLWPNDLSVMRSSEEIQEGAVIQVTYKTFVGESEVEYVLSEVSANRIVYETTDEHPLVGVVTIEVTANAQGQTLLHWYGHYSYPWYSPAGYFLRLQYLDKFFARLKENLVQVEQ